MKGWLITRLASVGLHELALGASFRKLWCQPGELGQYLVDKTDFGGKIVLVDVLGEEAADIAQAPDD